MLGLTPVSQKKSVGKAPSPGQILQPLKRDVLSDLTRGNTHFTIYLQNPNELIKKVIVANDR